MSVGVKAGDSTELQALLESIREYTRFDHPVNRFETAETHISLILLTGPVAYKFKKPVNLGFLDFSTLEKRKRCCEEEVRLNRRMTPELYLGVVGFTGHPAHPELQGDGDVIEYAVKMVQFPKYSELKYVLDDGRLTPVHIDDLAKHLAEFHAGSLVEAGIHYPGTSSCIQQQVTDNFRAFRSAMTGSGKNKEKLGTLEDWSLEMLATLQWEFKLRKRNGHVRECHGDLHLDNIILFEDRLRLFDCIEFSRDLRVIDVMSEVAFLFMDFDARDRAGIAWRFLNGYLQHTGDYPGLSVLRFYLVYRAMVRAKVGCIRLDQQGITLDEREYELKNVQNYIDQAVKYTKSAGKTLLITHGLSGSGKTWVSQQLLENLGAVRIRSDVERKRLYELTIESETGSPVSAPGSPLEGGMYSREKSSQTYLWLQFMAKKVLDAGFPVIIDAAFLKAQHRLQVQKFAKDNMVPFVILDFQADYATLKSRVDARWKEGKDVSDADSKVLEWQIKNQEHLDGDELRYAITIDTDATVDIDDIMRKIHASTGNSHSQQQPGSVDLS